jgi:hypothetical protein
MRLIIEATGDVVQRIGAVNLWLAHTQQVEIGAVEDEDERYVGHALFLASMLALSCRRSLYGEQAKCEMK